MWQEIYYIGHFCHGCLTTEYFQQGADPCRNELTRSENSSIARALGGLERRGLIESKTEQYGRDVVLESKWGKSYETTVPVRCKSVRLSVSYEADSPR